MKLKNKITSGFFIAIVVLIASGALSIIEFINLSNKVKSMLSDNYKSIEASNSMLNALDIIDENIMLKIINNDIQKPDKSGDSLFDANLHIVKNNLTEKDEDKYIQKIENSYIELNETKNSLANSDKDTSAIVYYHNIIKPKITNLKNDIKKLLELNQDKMYYTASEIENQARRSLMPGIIAIVAAVLFALIFRFFINRFIVKPISVLTENVNNFYKYRKVFTHNIQTKDEIEELYNAVEMLVIDIESESK